MDNLAHTLVGGALGQAGLKRKTGLAMPALMIAANLPDLDALGIPFGHNLAFRRGWTHGPIGLVVLPVLLALALWAFDRWQQGRGKRPASRLPVSLTWLIILSYIGIATHPFLDWLNTYGIRLLMPFSEQWFQGNTLFIIDIWLWIVLGVGVWLSRKRWKSSVARPGLPATVALVLTCLYVGAMHSGSRAAVNEAEALLRRAGEDPPDHIVAKPVPINSFRRDIAFQTGREMGFGKWRAFGPPRLVINGLRVPTRMDDPAVARAAQLDRRIADYLYWSQMPMADIRPEGDGVRVTLSDARYSRFPSRGTLSATTVIPAD